MRKIIKWIWRASIGNFDIFEPINIEALLGKAERLDQKYFDWPRIRFRMGTFLYQKNDPMILYKRTGFNFLVPNLHYIVLSDSPYIAPTWLRKFWGVVILVGVVFQFVFELRGLFDSYNLSSIILTILAGLFYLAAMFVGLYIFRRLEGWFIEQHFCYQL